MLKSAYIGTSPSPTGSQPTKACENNLNTEKSNISIITMTDANVNDIAIIAIQIFFFHVMNSDAWYNSTYLIDHDDVCDATQST